MKKFVESNKQNSEKSQKQILQKVYQKTNSKFFVTKLKKFPYKKLISLF